MKKVKVKLVGEDGNVFAIIAKVSAALRKDNPVKAGEFYIAAMACGSYDEVLVLVSNYVEII